MPRPTLEPGGSRRFTAVINPVSGGGHAGQRWLRLSALLSEAGAVVNAVESTGRDHATAISRSLAGDGEIVVAVGGDGLIRDVASGVVMAGGTMAIAPAGRGNDLARALELPEDDATLVELLLNAQPRPIDVLQVNDVSVPGNVYTGLDSNATQLINDWRRFPAALVYRVAPVFAWFRWKPTQFTITIDGVARTIRGHSVMVANSGRYGHGLNMVPSASVDDGLLDVLTIGDAPKLKMVTLMEEAKTGKHIRRAEIELSTGQEVEISSASAQSFSADGDVIGELPVTVRLRPGALRVLCPT